MPLYEYQCDRDGRFEVIRKFSDPPLKKCPTCGGPIQRLPSAPAIQFKGTGWYVTDYGGKGKSGGDKSESGDKGESDKSDSGKSGSGKSEEKSSSKGSSSKDSSAKKSGKD